MPQHHRRSASRRRRRRSVRAFLLTTVLAAVVVAAGARYLIGQYTPRTDALALSLASIQHSKQALQLEHQRERIILLTTATKNFKVVGKPRIAAVLPPPVASGAPIVAAPPPNPGTAEAIAYNMLASFGFKHNQYGCLYNIWMRESGWRYNAANASGAYGIPQALPGSKMASAGPNWQTNPTTQIRWGLGYIKGRYGTPCKTWAFWLANGWY